MMRALALAALRLYPRAWRERYGEEVTDLVTSRPAGPVRGRIVPIILALVLPLPVIAATAPHSAPGLRGGGTALAAAALLNALAWLPVLALLALGLPAASSAFVATVVAGALVSVWMSALIGRRALADSASRGALA